jgi:hypothetical protein
MGQKRALIAAVLIAVNASEFFTQDLEDFSFGAAGADENLDERIRAACRDLGKTEAQLVEWLGKKYGADAVESLTVPDKREVLEFLSSRVSRRAA